MSPRGLAAVALCLIVVAASLGLAGSLDAPRGSTASPAAAAASPVATSATSAASSSAATTSTTSGTVAARSSLQHQVLQTLATDGVPQRDIYLPNYEGGGRMDGDVVSPIQQIAPAPMGLGDFGVRNTTGTAVPYVIDSTSWEGTVTLNSGDFFYIDNDGPDTFGIQLNTVLTNVTVWGDPNDVFWTQDVMFFTPSQHEVQFLDNIWNFSNPSTSEPASTFVSGGYNGSPVSPTYYYDEGPTFTVGFPLTVHLYINASTTNATNGYEYSVVRFGFDLEGAGGVQLASGVYDTVEFESDEFSSSTFRAPHFQVNGGSLTPTDFLLYDSELMIGGPGGGSTTQIYALNGSMSLEYLDSTTHAYVNDPTAWDAGTDTGESAEGIAESYTTAGTVDLDAGPSFVIPLWNATPGGNAGRLTVTGAIQPDNAFLFVSPGDTLNNTTAAWAPVLPGGTYEFQLPAGIYSGIAMLTNHDSETLSWLGGAGTVSDVDISLPSDEDVGVDTPLFAWNNDQLANLSISGSGTASSPYVLPDDQFSPFLPYFGEMNDFLFPVFPGVLIADTSAYFELVPPPFTVVLDPGLAAEFGADGLPDTNQLQIEIYDSSHGTVIGGSDISGWFYGEEFAFPEPYLPTGEIVLWGDSSTLIADNVFQDQGVGIVLMQGSGNTIFGNEFLDGLLTTITFPVQFGIYEFESGDLIYNNAFDVYVPVYSPSYNLYSGFAQTNLDAWNLTGWQPASQVEDVNGFTLAGSVVGSGVVCGNWWYDYAPGDALPFVGYGAGFIAAGGDYCPIGPDGGFGYQLTFSESGLTSGDWSVTVAGITGTAAAGDSIAFGLPNGTWSYSVTAVADMIANPSSGSVRIAGAGASATIAFATSVSSHPADFLATVEETGLAGGTLWSVDIGASLYSTNGSSVAVAEPNGSYAFTVAPVADYSLRSGASGTLTIAGVSALNYTVFVPDPGWINATVSPSGASVRVAGTAVPLAFGGFSISESPGSYAIVVSDAGYATYYNNVTVAPATGTSLGITLQSLGGSPGNTTTTGSGSGGFSSGEFDLLLVGLLVVAVAIVAAALLVRRGGGRNRAPETYDSAPSGTAPASAPEYSEDVPPGSSG